jgi:hypothetical protein
MAVFIYIYIYTCIDFYISVAFFVWAGAVSLFDVTANKFARHVWGDLKMRVPLPCTRRHATAQMPSRIRMRLQHFGCEFYTFSGGAWLLPLSCAWLLPLSCALLSRGAAIISLAGTST